MKSLLLPALLTLSGYHLGMILVMQLIEYPSFAYVRPQEFGALHAAHNRGLGPTVFAPAALTLVLSIWFLVQRPAGVPAWVGWANLALYGLVLLATALLLAPLHVRLDQSGHDQVIIKTLVARNWLRVGLYAAQLGVLFWALVQLLAAAAPAK